MSTERIRGNLSTQSRLRGNLYRSGGGGSTVTIEPVYNSGIKIVDYSIDNDPGEIYIPVEQGFTITNLWNYVTDGNNNIYWSGAAITLNDSILNYDEIVVEIISYVGDLNDNWKSSVQCRLTTEILINALVPYNFTICTYDQRSSKFTFTDTSLQKVMGSSSDNGVINVYGVKY